ncbi:MAG: GFA family protein [Comamonadaceae bacterium]|nr:MAG: GFA family protein [Comamonadaceae bacterium]
MKDASSVLEGGCQCGAVRYRVRGVPFHQTLCHCSVCRRISGAPAVAWFTVSLDDFQLLSGAMTRFRSSDAAARSFCGICGTQLTFKVDGKPEIDITLCSLDDPQVHAPVDQTFSNARLPWMLGAHRLPAYPEGRPAEKDHES